MPALDSLGTCTLLQSSVQSNNKNLKQHLFHPLSGKALFFAINITPFNLQKQPPAILAGEFKMLITFQQNKKLHTTRRTDPEVGNDTLFPWKSHSEYRSSQNAANQKNRSLNTGSLRFSIRSLILVSKKTKIC